MSTETSKAPLKIAVQSFQAALSPTVLTATGLSLLPSILAGRKGASTGSSDSGHAKALSHLCEFIIDDFCKGVPAGADIAFYDALAPHPHVLGTPFDEANAIIAKGLVPQGPTGLAWSKHAAEIIRAAMPDVTDEGLKWITEKMYTNVLQAVDGGYYGIQRCPCEDVPVHSMTTFSCRTFACSADWRGEGEATAEDVYAGLKLTVAALIMTLARNCESWIGFNTVATAYKNRMKIDPSGRIILLDHPVDWRVQLWDIEAEGGQKVFWVLFQDDRNMEWRATSAPEKAQRFANRDLIHEDLRGIRGDELASKAGREEKDLIFVHQSGFTCGAKTLEGVLHMVRYKNDKIANPQPDA